jgi:hypothetical protein
MLVTVRDGPHSGIDWRIASRSGPIFPCKPNNSGLIRKKAYLILNDTFNRTGSDRVVPNRFARRRPSRHEFEAVVVLSAAHDHRFEKAAQFLESARIAPGQISVVTLCCVKRSQVEHAGIFITLGDPLHRGVFAWKGQHTVTQRAPQKRVRPHR